MECEDLLDEEVRKELIALADEELCSLEENPYSSHAPFSECYRPKDITDVSVLFKGYLNTLNAESRSVNSVLSDARHTLTQAHHHILYTADNPPEYAKEVDKQHHDDLKTTDAIAPGVHMPESSLFGVAGNMDHDTTQELETKIPSHESDLVTLVDDSDTVMCSNTHEDTVYVPQTEHTSTTTPTDNNVKLTLNKMITEQQTIEDQLTAEQQERESALDALIKENQRRHREKEQIMCERLAVERERAVVILQAFVRGRLARTKYKTIMEEARRTESATFIQAVWKGHRVRVQIARMVKAVCLIQQRWRQYRSRVRDWAVSVIHRYWRNYKVVAQRREAAVSLIQRRWRKYRMCKESLALQSSKDGRHSISSQTDGRLHGTTLHEQDNVPMNNIRDPSPSKLTISKRIQSSLRLAKQHSAHLLDNATNEGGNPSVRQTRSSSLPCQKSDSQCVSPPTRNILLPNMDWSPLKMDKIALRAVLNSDCDPQPSPGMQQTPPVSVPPTTPGMQQTPPVSVPRTTPGSNVLQRSPEVQQISLASESTAVEIGNEPSVQTGCDERESYLTDNRAQEIASEVIALKILRESREREERVAHMSRVRMSSLITEEEIQKVASQKRAHATYHQELEFTCLPLSPAAWLGLVTERLNHWKARHQPWVMPTHIQPPLHTQPPPHSHTPHTAKGLTNAQLVAASPKDTPLDRVAQVVVYRSRTPVDLNSLGKCPQLTSLSLTKCGLVSLSKLEGCPQLLEVTVQSNSIELIDIKGIPELSFADLSDNRLASIHGLHSCAHLLNLDLSENRLARLAGLDGCHCLQRLTVDSNLIINCKGLKCVPLLQSLSCSENHFPRVEGLESCSLLQHLGLAQNNLQQPPRLIDHVLLRELHLDGNSLSDVGLLSQSWLPLLQTLTLANNCITELGSLYCLLMLDTLDISNNSLYDLPLLLQSVRGCYQLRHLVVDGNPVSEEPKLRYYITKTLPYLETIDERQLRSKAPALPEVVTSSPVYELCKRQLMEQNLMREKADSTPSCDDPSSPEVTRTLLRKKVSCCQDYQSLLIKHLREHECLEMGKDSQRERHPCSNETSDVELQQIKAAVTLQSAWRGFKGRQLVKTIRLVFNNAAIVIQAHYKGYRLRSRLRKLLENVRYTDGKEQISDSVGGVGDQGDDVMGGANVEVNFEEEIIVDYLDESLLDVDLAPMSPTEPILKRYIEEETVEPILMPGYSLPGCLQTDITLVEWKSQQACTARVPESYSIPTETPVRSMARVPESYSTPTETPVRSMARVPEGHRESAVDRKCGADSQPRAAWGSATQLSQEMDLHERTFEHSYPVSEVSPHIGLNVSDRIRDGCGTKERTRDGRGTKERIRDGCGIKERIRDGCGTRERITGEWGFQSSATADLMLKRTQRQKKLHSDALKRKKLADPSERLAAFRKKATPPVRVTQGHQHRVEYSHAQSTPSPLTSLQQTKDDHLYQWVNNHSLVHDRHHGRGDTAMRLSNKSQSVSGGSSFLPQLEPHVLAGYSPQLVLASSAQSQAVRDSSKCTRASNSYPSFKQSTDKQNMFTTNSSNNL